MTELEILDILYQAFQLALRLALPFLLISMLVSRSPSFRRLPRSMSRR